MNLETDGHKCNKNLLNIYGTGLFCCWRNYADYYSNKQFTYLFDKLTSLQMQDKDREYTELRCCLKLSLSAGKQTTLFMPVSFEYIHGIFTQALTDSNITELVRYAVFTYSFQNWWGSIYLLVFVYRDINEYKAWNVWDLCLVLY